MEAGKAIIGAWCPNCQKVVRATYIFKHKDGRNWIYQCQSCYKEFLIENPSRKFLSFD